MDVVDCVYVGDFDVDGLDFFVVWFCWCVGDDVVCGEWDIFGKVIGYFVVVDWIGVGGGGVWVGFWLLWVGIVIWKC